ncbi:MAG TPA: ShlB/FhaC/HecB family hemolysin secretion/activation protein [Allosphingosinicella sp.]|jgi:hemolysin activation/secretion protein
MALFWLGALTAAVPAPSAAAQPPKAPRPRTGPDAAQPAAPPFAAPGPPPLIQPPQTPTAPAPGAEAGGAVSAVRVLDDRTGRDVHAVPPAGWRPAADALSGLRLHHRPGEPLNAQWVRRQFALNFGDAARAGPAVALVQLINRAFLAAGFVNSGLLVEPDSEPRQLVLRLIHGRLAAPPGGEAVEVAFSDGDARGLSAGYIRDRMPSAARQPLSAVEIERDFRLLTEDPALRTVNVQLRPGSAPGEAGLALVVLPRERADLYFTAGNSRSPTVGGNRIGLGGYFRNALAGGDLFSAEAGLTRGVADISAAYVTPLFDPGTMLNLRGSYNEAAVIDAPLLPLNIRTRDVAGQVSIVRQLLREPLTPAGEGRWSPSRSLTAGVGISHRRQNSFLLGEPFSFAPGSVGGRAEYTALRLIGDYVVRNVDKVFAASITGTVGISGTRSDQPLVLNPDRHFLSLLVQLNYAQRLSDEGLELRARLSGQLASSILYSGERLGIGGESSVRGYRETLLLGDQGLVGSVELALPFSISRGEGPARAFDWGAFSIAAFIDGGVADNVEGPDPEPSPIGSSGLALTWRPGEALSLRVSYGHAFVFADPTGTSDLQDDGVHIRLTLYPLRLLGRR